jgi:hypothetical protein
MAGNGSTFAVTTATTKSKSCRALRTSGIGAADHGERGISVTVGNWQRVPTLARRVTSNLRLLESSGAAFFLCWPQVEEFPSRNIFICAERKVEEIHTIFAFAQGHSGRGERKFLPPPPASRPFSQRMLARSKSGESARN